MTPNNSPLEFYPHPQRARTRVRSLTCFGIMCRTSGRVLVKRPLGPSSNGVSDMMEPSSRLEGIVAPDIRLARVTCRTRADAGLRAVAWSRAPSNSEPERALGEGREKGLD